MKKRILESRWGLAGLIGLASLAVALPVQCAETLRVGITPTLPPMAYREGKQLTGMEVDMAKALGEHLGRPVEFVEVKWEDQIPWLTKGRTDIIMSSMSITRGRMMQVQFSTPYLRVGQMALVRGEDRGRYLLGFPPGMSSNIGVKKGTTGDFLIQQEWPKAKRKYYKTGDAAAKALLKKRIELFVADATLIWWLSGTYEAQGLTAMPYLLSDEQLAWAVRKGDTQLLEQANTFLRAAASDGRFEAIRRLWLPEAP